MKSIQVGGHTHPINRPNAYALKACYSLGLPRAACGCQVLGGAHRSMSRRMQGTLVMYVKHTPGPSVARAAGRRIADVNIHNGAAGGCSNKLHDTTARRPEMQS